MRTTDEQRAELRKKTQAATPGPWRMAGTPEKPCPVVSATHREKGYQVHSMLHVKQVEPNVWPHMRETYCRDAAFIAAANPETVGALLDDVDELRADKVAIASAIGYAGPVTGLVEACASVLAERDELRERVRALEAKAEQRRDVLARWKSGEMMKRPDVWTLTNAALED